MFIQIIAAFFATVFFSILFNVNKKELIVCGVVGSSGWAIYLITSKLDASIVLASFFGALLVSILSHLLAIYRKNPATVYQIPGIIPLVPGAGMYKSLLYLIQDRFVLSAQSLVETFQIAGAIAVAMLSVYSVSLFAAQIKQAVYQKRSS